MTVPTWVKDAVFYQIFPDRFFNGTTENDPPNLEPWGSSPTIQGFQGGDLQGTAQKLDYLTDMGITALYLNPIFLSPSTHRYNTTDYYQIDPKLGRLDDFKQLLSQAHQRGMRVILDGVFNHCSRGFFAFSDILENQAKSAYKDWFHIRKFPIDAFSPGDAEDYVAWWKYKSLPKFNTDNPAVRRYLLDVARYWIDFGIDGWRLDVPNEIDDDSFWDEFRRIVKQANPDAYLLGEIWDGNPRWVGDQHFDGLMDYPFREAVLGLVNGTWDVRKYQARIDQILHAYPPENILSQYVLLGSHDVERALTMCGGSTSKLRLAVLLQMVHPGAPAVYYGDEIGLTGGKDPACRGAFNWDEKSWNWEIHNWTKNLISLRHSHPGWRKVAFTFTHQLDDQGCVVFTRGEGEQRTLVVINPDSHSKHITLDGSFVGWTDGTTVRDALMQQEYVVHQNALQLNLPAYGALLLERN